MVASADPRATAAGLAMLAKGGSAVDAAIAVQAVLGLVEPQSSGIGGGGFLMHYDPGSGELIAYDGRETAPRGLDPSLFLDDRGQPLGFFEAALGGAAVGTPGVIAMLEMAHKEQGRLPWADLFAPAIALAEDGFEITERLHDSAARAAGWFERTGADLADVGAFADYLFTDDGAAKPVGTVLRNPAYALTLRAVASGGAAAFYTGPIAEAMVAAVQTADLRPGALSLTDLAEYQPVKRDPVCGSYRAVRLCSMGPPSSGATTMLAILGILEGFDLAEAGVQTQASVHLFAEASRLAYADRGRFVADPAFVPVPTKGLIDPQYLSLRRQQIDPDQAMDSVAPGPVPRETAAQWADHDGIDYPATSHMTIVDAMGRVVSFTTTVQIGFGSYVMAEGFLLNNQLTDFSFRLRDEDGTTIANRPEPLKRPRSSMTPTIAFDANGDFAFAIGSPGGGNILSYVAKAVIGLIDWDLTVQQAIALPNMVDRGATVWLEEDTPLAELAEPLQAMGHEVSLRGMRSGLHGIVAVRDGEGRLLHYEGGADPRREGVAAGK